MLSFYTLEDSRKWNCVTEVLSSFVASNCVLFFSSGKKIKRSVLCNSAILARESLLLILKRGRPVSCSASSALFLLCPSTPVATFAGCE